MTDRWAQVRLGDVLALNNRKLGPHAREPEVLSLSKYQGFVRASEYFDKRIASKSLEGYKVVEPEEWAFSTIHIDEGSIARNLLGIRGVISPMYTTLTWIGRDHDPRYFALALRSPAMLRTYGANARGSINRRRSLPYAAFAKLTLEVPPLVVQRRIVDLMEHLDTHLANLEAERSAASATLESLVKARFSSGAHSRHLTLAQVADIQLGRMLSKERAAGSEQAPYVRNANIQWSGLDLTDLKQMSFPSDSRERYSLRAGDILVCEGGDPGRCVLLEHDLPGIYYQKAVHRVRPIHAIPWFVYGCLRAAYLDGSISDLCTNTTIAHLTGEKFRTLKVPDVEIREQAGLAVTLRASMEHVSRVEEEIDRSRGVRSVLLQSLLSGHHEIPDSYDALLAVS